MWGSHCLRIRAFGQPRHRCGGLCSRTSRGYHDRECIFGAYAGFYARVSGVKQEWAALEVLLYHHHFCKSVCLRSRTRQDTIVLSLDSESRRQHFLCQKQWRSEAHCLDYSHLRTMAMILGQMPCAPQIWVWWIARADVRQPLAAFWAACDRGASPPKSIAAVGCHPRQAVFRMSHHNERGGSQARHGVPGQE